jgi:hypothetical protein
MFENEGHCLCCDQDVKFVAVGTWWRDQYVCSSCGSIPRERAIMYCIDRYFPDWRTLSIHESSPIPRGASVRLQKEAPNYLASQWFPDVPTGSVRCENLEALSFPDDSLDLHVTQDVLEHIFEPAAAFREIARTLKPGGAHVFTTPLVNKHSPSTVCARRRLDGDIDHLVMPPEYHGNPVSADGALVTMRWGYDITRIIFEASGLYTDTIIIDSLDFGIRADYIEVLA